MIAHTIWRHKSAPHFPPLTTSCAADVVVVGAGVAGLTAAYFLTKAGYDVMALDKAHPAGGMTARSTAHLSCAVDGGWRGVVKNVGLSAAQLAAEAYKEGLRTIHSIQEDAGIRCGFTWVDSFLAATPQTLVNLRNEHDAAHAAGIAAHRIDYSPLADVPPSHLLCFPGQARLDPILYCDGLVNALRHRVRFFQANIQAVSERTHIELRTDTGITVVARRAIILATNSGLQIGTMRGKQKAQRSYVIAATTPKGSVSDVLCWDMENPYHYTRIHAADDPALDIVLVGGEDRSGEDSDVTDRDEQKRFDRLEQWARKQFPTLGLVIARWSGLVHQTPDRLGLLGRHPDFENVYVIDGDSGLGFNHATIGALITRDLIAGTPNSFTAVFDPSRFRSNAS